MIIQFCGMSGAGKSTLAEQVKIVLAKENIAIEIIDADDYRKNVIKDLGFSRENRNENIRRLAFIANKFSQHNIVSIICAINPYEEIRQEIKLKYPNVKTIFINCGVEELTKRDTKGLYKMAALPDDNPGKLRNLTGVNDPFEKPTNADLVIDTDKETVEISAEKLGDFIRTNYAKTIR